MIEFVFPAAATVFLYFVAVPVLTIVSALMLRVIRSQMRHAHEMGSMLVWLLLVVPVLLPSAWFVAAVFHQLDGHHAMVECLAPHGVSIVCIDLILVALFVVAPLTVGALRQPRRAPQALRDASAFGVRYMVGADVPGLACTSGLMRPQIQIDEAIEHALDNEQLRSVLLHEAAHVRGRDPLRKWIVRLCLSVNPLAVLLRGDVARWQLGREVRCDLAAVADGADRFRLAEALVRVARRAPQHAQVRHCCGLVALDSLDLRVRVLCEGALPAIGREYVAGAAVLLSLMVLPPNHVGVELLDWLHGAAEASWMLLAGG